MNNKEWLKEVMLKEKVDVLNSGNFSGYEQGYLDSLEFSKDAINQLDEPTKVVIPKHVAEWMDTHKHRYTRLLEFGADFYDGCIQASVHSWVLKNDELFIRAWRYGYTVEEEKKYYVLGNKGKIMLKKYKAGVSEITVGTMTTESEWFEPDKYSLTEKEIKDYDERYWQFAEEIKKENV